MSKTNGKLKTFKSRLLDNIYTLLQLTPITQVVSEKKGQNKKFRVLLSKIRPSKIKSVNEIQGVKSKKNI